MYAGIDFGTSNCAIGLWEEKAPRLLTLDGDQINLPSHLYIHRYLVQTEQVDEDQLQSRIKEEKRNRNLKFKKIIEELPVQNLSQLREDIIHGRIEHYDFEIQRRIKIANIKSDAEIEQQERRLFERELAEAAQKKYREQTQWEALEQEDCQIDFGHQAIKQHFDDPDGGFFIRSPKSFLGTELKSFQRYGYTEIVKRILGYIKSQAEQKNQIEIDSIVLGRPVHFYGGLDQQAQKILETAARSAGFSHIEFLYEPIAAALDFELRLEQDKTVLVFDAGGGTTDCSMVQLGPSYRNLNHRDRSILAYEGRRSGGMDLDIQLAYHFFMPYFGKDARFKNGLLIPNALFWNAVKINDIHAIKNFLSDETAEEIERYIRLSDAPEKFERLYQLHQNQSIYLLNYQAEQAKIQLSEKDRFEFLLDLIDPPLSIPVDRESFSDKIEIMLDEFIDLMKETEKQAQTKPDVIYITGGTARSPIIQNWIRSHYQDIPIISGNMFGSVAAGLTVWAHRIYGL